MKRALSVCAVLLALPLLCWADEPPTETVIKMTVQPMAAPKPALRYRLLPELSEMNPGNPCQAYLKCFMEQNNFYYEKESVANREKWQTMPLKELPLKELKNYGGSSLRMADYAARLTTPDWQILLQLKSEGIGLLLPDIQLLRTLAAALKVRFRAEVAEHRYNDAVRTAKTLFALARHLGEHPTLIGNLVGTAIAFVTIGPLEEMIQQPGCPNLYWALSELPEPMVDMRHGFEGEKTFQATEFAWLDDNTPMSEAKLQAALEHYRGLLTQAETTTPKAEDLSKWLDVRAKDEGRVAAARKRLVEAGSDADKIKQFPALQVILLDEKLTCEIRRDEEMKAMTLPYWQAEPIFKRAQAARKDEQESLFLVLLPSSEKVRRAQGRLEQRLALLRCVEAIRMYAADHDGKLPAQLSDVEVPLPVDPFSGKPFAYKLDGATANLRGSSPPGLEKEAVFNLRYEITIAK